MLRGLGLSDASGGDIFARMKVWARREGGENLLGGRQSCASLRADFHDLSLTFELEHCDDYFAHGQP